MHILQCSCLVMGWVLFGIYNMPYILCSNITQRLALLLYMQARAAPCTHVDLA